MSPPNPIGSIRDYYITAPQQQSIDLPANSMSPIIPGSRDGLGITAIPGAGAMMRVFKTTSAEADIEADLADGSLSYANLIAGIRPTRSRWMLWASGAVTADTWQSPAQSEGDMAIIATATGGPGALEVTR